mmetsp:Transcript_53734/g.126549  ORF Transcript_53734/g.126549 Transcript_53734/m.126549 type:complete len:235 (-) Transcript_53734:393-1097(-)
MVHHPLLACLQFGRGRTQRRANGLAGRKPQQHIGLSPPSDDRAGAATGCPLGCQDLGQHAAPADARARAARHALQLGITRLRVVDEARLRVLARVCRVQAALVGEDHQHIGLDEIGHQGPQRVVVAELDLVVDDGVVLVDDRQHTVGHQSQQRRAGIEVALTVRQVGMCEQHLGAVQAVGTKLAFVHLRQAHLADGRRRLQLVQFLGPRRPAQPLHALGDGAAGHHHQLPPLAC